MGVMHTLPVINAQITEKAKLKTLHSMFPHNRSLRAVTDDVNLNIIEVTVSQDYNDLYNKPLTNGTDRIDADRDIYVSNKKLAKEEDIPSLTPYRTAAEQDVIDNGKQAVINDLSNIRSGAAAGATAIQPGANVSGLTNDAGYLTLQTLPRWDGN